MLIECCGAPGSGKSAFASELCRSGALHGLRIVSVSTTKLQIHERLADRMRAALRKGSTVLLAGLIDPVRSIALVMCVLASRQRSVRDACKAIVNALEVSNLVRLWSNRRAIGIMDQGPCQAAWSIAWSAGTPGIAFSARLSRVLPPAQATIVIRASRDRLLDRLRSRGEHHSRLERALREDDSSVDRAIAISEGIVATMRTRRLLVIDNDGDRSKLSVSAARMAQALSASPTRRTQRFRYLPSPPCPS
jgi:thymidylate kinase